MSAYMSSTLGQIGRETEILNLAVHSSMSKLSGGFSVRLSIEKLSVLWQCWGAEGSSLLRSGIQI